MVSNFSLRQRTLAFDELNVYSDDVGSDKTGDKDKRKRLRYNEKDEVKQWSKKHYRRHTYFSPFVVYKLLIFESKCMFYNFTILFCN